MDTFLTTISDVEAQEITTSFKRYQVSEGITVDYLTHPREFIKQVAENSGCVYPIEVEHFIACLRRGLAKHRAGARVDFNPNLWEHTMALEQLYDVRVI